MPATRRATVIINECLSRLRLQKFRVARKQGPFCVHLLCLVVCARLPFIKEMIEIIEAVAVYWASWFFKQHWEILGVSLPRVIIKCLVTYCVFFLVDLGNLNHGEPRLVLPDGKEQKCFIWSCK